MVFQPIWDFNAQKPLGYEALVRGPVELESPMGLFAVAQKFGEFQAMELLCIEKTIEEIKVLPGVKVFINISPQTLLQHHKYIISLLLQQPQNKFVLELAENGLSVKARAELVELLSLIRSKGIEIAFDDVGGGDRSISNICELPSDYLKIDRDIIQGLTRYKNGSASHYFAATKALVSIANEIGAAVIAEGVETELQLQNVTEAGINLIQGFYISRPKPIDYWVEGKGECERC